MVLNSMGEEKKEDSPQKEHLIDGVVTPQGSGKLGGEAAKAPEVVKPKIDFNVSEEDLAKHKALQEEERKADLKKSEEEKEDPDKKDAAPVFKIGDESDYSDEGWSLELTMFILSHINQ